MHNKAKSQVNSLPIALILTQLGAKSAVLNGLNYPELRLFNTHLNTHPDTLLPLHRNGRFLSLR